MKMKLLLFLCWVLCVSAQNLHEDIRIIGCSDHDGEHMYSLDGEEVWYADFIRGVGVDPQPPFVDHMIYVSGIYEFAVGEQQTCKSNLKIARQATKDIPPERDAPSSLIIYSKEAVELEEENTLICHVSGFFPAPVNVSWTKNNQKVTEGTSINVPYPNKDGTFHQVSRLKFTPQLGDIYSCSVEHLALQGPMTRTWDVEKTLPGVGPAVFCGVGLTIGLLGVAAGTFFLVKGNECS